MIVNCDSCDRENNSWTETGEGNRAHHLVGLWEMLHQTCEQFAEFEVAGDVISGQIPKTLQATWQKFEAASPSSFQDTQKMSCCGRVGHRRGIMRNASVIVSRPWCHKQNASIIHPSSFIVRFPCYAEVGRFPAIKLLQLVLWTSSPRDFKTLVFLRL